MNPTDEAQGNDRSAVQKRRSKRIPLEAIVHYQIDGSEFINLSSNLSSEGIFIRNFSPPPVGTKLKIKAHLPEEFGGVPVQLFGEVVRVVDGVGLEERGMGVEFTSVHADTLEAIRYFVSEVYEVAEIESPKFFKDERAGRYGYSPGREDILRLKPEGPAGQGANEDPERLSQHRLFKSILLMLVGFLLGGGFVFLFFLID